jgi:hypothetical protein
MSFVKLPMGIASVRLMILLLHWNGSSSLIEALRRTGTSPRCG